MKQLLLLICLCAPVPSVPLQPPTVSIKDYTDMRFNALEKRIDERSVNVDKWLSNLQAKDNDLKDQLPSFATNKQLDAIDTRLDQLENDRSSVRGWMLAFGTVFTLINVAGGIYALLRKKQ
jgi:3-dehydroquinate dehydratase